jgi:tRNA(fMet)-specific endonuclease VapC
MIVADTDVLVDYLRDAGAAARVEFELASGKLATTVVAAFELTQGARTAADEETIATLLSALTLIPLSAESARRAGQLRRDLRRQRQDIGVADCLVAGICLTHGAILLTRNRDHFSRVPNLTLAALSPA